MNEFVPLRGGTGIAEPKPRPASLAVVRREPDGAPERHCWVAPDVTGSTPDNLTFSHPRLHSPQYKGKEIEEPKAVQSPSSVPPHPFSPAQWTQRMSLSSSRRFLHLNHLSFPRLGATYIGVVVSAV